MDARQSGYNVDMLLQQLVSIVNRLSSETQIGITVTAGGAVITGALVPAAAWAELADANLRSTNGPDSFASALAELFTVQASRLQDSAQAVSQVQEALDSNDSEAANALAAAVLTEAAPRVLHLRDARLRDHDQWMPTEGVNMRVRIAAVDSWFLGILR